mgnify:CR=1 FL=1
MTTDISTDLLDESSARQLTERIRATLDTTARGLDRLAAYVSEAYSRRADLALGYRSWAEYASAEFGEETKDLAAPIRRQLVGYLSADGMSTRAIAPVAGVSNKTVSLDRAAGVTSGNTSPAPSTRPAPVTTEFVDTATGEIFDVDDNTAAFIEADLTEDEFEHGLAAARQSGDLSAESVINNAPRKVTGLDGKTYSVPQQPVQQEPRTMRKPLPDQITNNIFDLSRKAERLDALTEDDRFPKNKEKVAARNRNDLLRTIDTLQRVLAKLDGPVE